MESRRSVTDSPTEDANKTGRLTGRTTRRQSTEKRKLRPDNIRAAMNAALFC